MRTLPAWTLPVLVLRCLVACSDSSGGGDGGQATDPDAGSPSLDASSVPPTPDAGTDAKRPCVNGAPERQTDAHDCGSCGHDCEGGSCSAGKCQAYTLATTTDVEGIAIGVAAVGGKVYFTTNQQLGGTIQSVSLMGGAKTVIESYFSSAGFLVSDGTTLFIGGQGGVYQRPIAGGSTTLLADTAANVSGLALDGATLYVSAGGSVKKLPKAGGTVEDVPTGANGLVGLAFAAPYLYATDYGAFKTIIYDTTGATATKSITDDMAFPQGIAVVGSEIWYGRLDLDGAGGVYARPADGTGAKRAIVPGVDARCVFVTQAALYFTAGHEVRKLVR